MEALDRISQQIIFLTSLILKSSDPKMAARVVGKLKRRLDSEYLSEDRKQNLTTILDSLITNKEEGGKAWFKEVANNYEM